MKKWSNLRNTESGYYKLSTMVLAIALAGMLLWQGVFAMLGVEAFRADAGDGLQEQRQAAWRNAVRNPAAEGGVWNAFWAEAPFGAAHTGAGGAASAVPEIPAVGETFVYNYIPWRVLYRQADAALIVTEYVYSVGTQFHSAMGQTPLERSTLRQNLSYWAANHLGGLRQRALTPNGANTSGDTVTTPGALTTSNAAVFILSRAEIYQYFENNNDARIARNTGGTPVLWWFRQNAAQSAVWDNGVFIIVHHNTRTPGFRPALWISI